MGFRIWRSLLQFWVFIGIESRVGILGILYLFRRLEFVSSPERMNLKHWALISVRAAVRDASTQSEIAFSTLALCLQIELINVFSFTCN